MPAPTISPLPSPPSRSTDPTNFATEADAFVAALPEFVSDANAQASYLDGVAAAVDADAAAAAASAADALVSETNAAASAAGAASAADVGAWVSGTTYAIGDCVFSLVDFQTYRRITNGGGTTDPSADAVNWVAITGAGGGNIIKALASGDLFDGAKVVLNSDGTVSAVSSTITQLATPTIAASYGAFSATTPLGLSAAINPKNNMIAFLYSTGGSVYLTIGEIIGSSIRCGSGTYLAGANTNYSSVAFDDLTDQIIAAFVLTSDSYLYCNISYYYRNGSGTLSVFGGGNIAVRSATTLQTNVEIIPNAGKFVIAHNANGVGQAIVGVTGYQTATFGTPTALTGNGASIGSLAAAHIGGDRFAMTFRSFNSPSGVYAVAGQISGTSITFGTQIQLSGVSSTNIDCACDIANQRMVATYTNPTSNNIATGHIVAISGTALTAGNVATIAANSSTIVSVSYNEQAKNFCFNYANGADSGKQYMRTATVSATAFTMSNAVLVNANTSATFVFNAFVPVLQKNYGFALYSSSMIMNQFTTATISTNLTSGNYIGISSGSYTNGQQAKIQAIGSVDDAQSGLTPGSAYYVGIDGSLKLTAALWEPAVFAGTAITATKLLVKG